MKDVVKERVDKYLSRCGENGDEFIARGYTDDGDYECGYCGTVFADVEPEDRPNFCPECGVLLDWTQEEED